jgi:hypothetical protein
MTSPLKTPPQRVVADRRGIARNTPQTKSDVRRERIRELSDSDLAEVHTDVAAEQKRRRRESIEVIHKDDPDRIRFWRRCPICHDRACRSQRCRDAERRLAQRGRRI